MILENKVSLGSASLKSLFFALFFSLIMGCGQSKISTSDNFSPNTLTPTSQPPIVNRDFRDITISALGDSITAGYNSGSLFSEEIRNSWSVGTQLLGEGSHYSRLKSKVLGTGINVRAYAFARNGGEILKSDQYSLQAQANLLANRLETQDLNYVTLLMGGNDVCEASLPDTDFKTQIKNKLRTAINTVGPKADIILMASIPNLNDVLNKVQCPMLPPLRELILNTVCPNRQNLSEQEIVQSVRLVNQAIEEVAESSPYNVVFDDNTVFKTPLTDARISNFDCFHPSARGQKDLSQALWPYVKNYFAETIPSFE